jgi:hypothetical protein
MKHGRIPARILLVYAEDCGTLCPDIAQGCQNHFSFYHHQYDEE